MWGSQNDAQTAVTAAETENKEVEKNVENQRATIRHGWFGGKF